MTLQQRLVGAGHFAKVLNGMELKCATHMRVAMPAVLEWQELAGHFNFHSPLALSFFRSCRFRRYCRHFRSLTTIH